MPQMTRNIGIATVLALCVGALWAAGAGMASADETPTAKTFGAGNADGMVKLVFML